MFQQNKTAKNFKQSQDKIKICVLGGVGEVGRNLSFIEYRNQILVFDCGLRFPEEDMPGIDFIIPNELHPGFCVPEEERYPLQDHFPDFKMILFGVWDPDFEQGIRGHLGHFLDLFLFINLFHHYHSVHDGAYFYPGCCHRISLQYLLGGISI